MYMCLCLYPVSQARRWQLLPYASKAMQATCVHCNNAATHVHAAFWICVCSLRAVAGLIVGVLQDSILPNKARQRALACKVPRVGCRKKGQLAHQLHVQLHALALRPHGLRMFGGLGPASTAPHSYSRTRDLSNLSNAGCKRSSANALATEHTEQHTTSRETMSVTFKRDHAKRVATSKEESVEGDS
jgi:hypothetical protein